MIKKTVVAMLLVSVLFCFGFSEQKDIPKKAIKFVEKANSAFEAKDLEKAGKFLEKAKEVYPDYSEIYVVYAKINMGQKKNLEAVELFKKALELDPDNQKAQALYVDLLILLGQGQMRSNPKKAIEYFETVLKINDVHAMIPKKNRPVDLYDSSTVSKIE